MLTFFQILHQDCKNYSDFFLNCVLSITLKKLALTFKNFFKAIKTLFKIRKEGRNYAWQQNMTETYPLLFKLPPWDIYYIKKYYKKKPSLLETILFYLNSISVISGNNGSIQMLLWLQLMDLSMYNMAKLINVKKALKHDFKEDHPFYKNV